MNEKSWRCVTRKCFAELLGGPGGRRVIGDRHMHDTTALMRENDQHEQESAGCRRDDEEVSGRNLLKVVGEERSPGLRGWFVSAYHVLRDGRLRDVEPEFQQLAVNAGRAHNGLLRDIVRISARRSRGTVGRPVRGRLFQVQ